jgi:diguanylate cyclase (GGDEF)-like protein
VLPVLYVALGAAWIIVNIAKPWGPAEFLPPVLAGAAVVTAGAVVLKPKPARAWLAMAVGVVLMAAGGSHPDLLVSGATGGDHHWWPDAFNLPGHLLVCLGAVLLLAPGARRLAVGAVLEGAALAASSYALLWLLLVEPRLGASALSTGALVVVPVHAAVSCFLLVVALHACRGNSAHARQASNALALATVMLWAGDVLFLLSAIEVLPSTPSWWNLCYVVASLSVGWAFAHPSVRHLSHHRGEVVPGRWRSAAVAALLALVVVLALVRSPANPRSEVITVVVVLTVVALAFARLLQSLRQHRAAREAAELASRVDSLTGLPNRAGVAQVAQERRLVDPQEPVAVLFVDVDRFRYVNDTLGHRGGDALLVEVAKRLSSLVPPGCVLGRLGGDGFLLVLSGAVATSALELASAVNAILAPPVEVEGESLEVTASIGVARGTWEDKEEILYAADTARSRAKSLGGAQVCLHDEAMSASARRQLALEGGLRSALSRGEVHLAYQPITDRAGATVMTEALMRWHSASLGDVSPAEFIPVAESSGVVVELGRWALEEACRQTQQWREGGMDLRVAVNISPVQVVRTDLVAEVKRALEGTGLPAAALELEITEGVLVGEAMEAHTTFDELRALGVRLSIDDFGTGYSSLAYLDRFPVSKLKLDRAFTTGLSAGSSRRHLVAAVVGMANALGHDLVAEGVETTEQLEQLRELGCSHFQGYLVSRPLDALAFQAWLSGGSAASGEHVQERGHKESEHDQEPETTNVS